MSEGEIARGTFGRRPGQPARAETVQLPHLSEDDLSREDKIDLAVQQIAGYRSLIDDDRTSLEHRRAYVDSISNVLDRLAPDEQEEVLSKLDQVKIIRIKEE